MESKQKEIREKISMKESLTILFGNLPSVASVIGATLLALNGIKGWWGFLFVAVLLAVSYNSREKESNK